MGVYKYTAKDLQSRTKKGVIEADSMRQARQLLRNKDLLPIDITEVAEKNRSKASFSLFKQKIKTRDMALMMRQLSTLLKSGMPLDEALLAVSEQSENKRVAEVLLGVRGKVLEGFSLASAMESFPSIFSQLYSTTVESGEHSGRLDYVLTELAVYSEKQHKLKQQVMQALMYPCMVMLVSILVVTFLLTDVVPKIVAVFTQTKQALPTATIILIAMSNFIRSYGYIVLAVIFVLIVLFRYLYKKHKVKMVVDGFLLKVPIIGKQIKMINSARFARTLAILNSSGVGILSCLQGATKTISSLPMRTALEGVHDQVKEGVALHVGLKQAKFFTPMFVHLVASGESGGNLDEMLLYASDYQEQEVEALLKNILTLFEPIMILVMGGIVLFIVLAILLPIFNMDQFAGN
jgi:general secretion pathway protein F